MMIKISRLLTLMLLLIAAAPAYAAWPWDRWIKPKPPSLIIADPIPMNKKTYTRQSQDLLDLVAKIAADANTVEPGPRLVVVTHGWKETSDWHKDLAMAVRDSVAGGPWICGWYDWRAQAKRSGLLETTRLASETYGPSLGRDVLAISKEWKQIHLIGNSSGCWLMSQAAKVITEQSKASVHLTFLDAYVPWHQEELGCVACQPGTVCWADHYFSRDLSAPASQKPLPYALNIDLSEIDPRINSHEFPHIWYEATAVGRFTDRRYKDKPLYNRVGEIEYGYARSLEAGEVNWEYSLRLQGGNEPLMVIAK